MSCCVHRDRRAETTRCRCKASSLSFTFLCFLYTRASLRCRVVLVARGMAERKHSDECVPCHPGTPPDSGSGDASLVRYICRRYRPQCMGICGTCSVPFCHTVFSLCQVRSCDFAFLRAKLEPAFRHTVLRFGKGLAGRRQRLSGFVLTPLWVQFNPCKKSDERRRSTREEEHKKAVWSEK